jgi:hypothetical protein
MSALAYAPEPLRRSAPDPHRRNFEIVTTRAQKKARPKSFYAVVTLSSVFGVLLVQLLLSIVLSSGAYQISDLQAKQKDLARTEQALSEQLDLLSSPQSLATRAESIGMVVGTTAPVFLRLADGTVVGSTGATNGSKSALGPTGSLVPNSLLDSAQPGIAPVEDTSSSIGGANGDTALVSASGPAITTGGSLPSPVTR